MRLTVLVVDDEPLARDGLKLLLGRQPRVASVSEARNGREAVALIRQQKPDLVLLDVQMPRMDGFAVVQAVGAEHMPAVIFVTAHDQYAIRAFEIAAVDYLLKPVSEERFSMAFERASSRLQRAPHEKETGQVLAMLDVIANPPRQLARLAIRSGERTFFVPVNDVDRIEALQNYVQVHVGATSHLLHVPMNTIETVLDPAALSAHPSFAHRERPTDCAALVGGARPVRHRAEVGRAPPFRPDLSRAHSWRPVESVLGSRAPT